MAANSDTNFKQLFAFPELACELFRAAVPLPWARRTKPGDFVRVNSSYVSRDGKQRHDDMVWCLHRGPRPSIYMLVEFQSRPEKLMALRMFSYACLLCEDLVRQRRATHGRVPLLLPVVLHSGRTPWNVATSLRQLRPQLDPYLAENQPELKYRLVDRNTSSKLLHALLELEEADERESRLLPAIHTIAGWARTQRNNELSRTLANWIRRQIGNAFDLESLPAECSLEEIYMMFEHRFKNFEHLLEFQAIERGREQGIEQGIEQGRVETELAERRRILWRLIEHAGIRISDQIAHAAAQANAATLAHWIDRMIEHGELPPELVAK